MMIAAAERIEEFSLEIRFLPFWKSRLNINLVYSRWIMTHSPLRE
jgi:hypothetical protein